MPFQDTLLDNYIEDTIPSTRVQFACMIEPDGVVFRKLT